MSLAAHDFEAPRAARRVSWLSSRHVLALLDGPPLVIVYGLLALGLFSAAWAHPLSRVIGVGPDPPVFIWYLRWVPFAISHGMNPLVTNYLDYPDGINLMWQTSVPLLGLLLWPVTATLGPIFSYNLLMTTSVALSAYCGFVACRQHVSQAWPAAIAGLLFGFSPYMLAQSLGHPHVGVTFICPLMLIAFEEAVIRQRARVGRLGLAIGVLGAAQLLMSEELLLTQLLMATLAVAILCGLRPDLVRVRLTYLAKATGVAAGIIATIGAVPLWVQFFGPQAVYGTVPASNVFVSDLAGFVLPTSLQALAPPAVSAITDRFAGSQYEGVAYLGIPLLLVLIAGTLRWWRIPAVQVFSLLALLGATLSLGLTLHVGGRATGAPAALLAIVLLPLIKLPAGRLVPVLFAMTWLGLPLVPILDNVVPTRLMVYVVLFASLLVALFADRWLAMPLMVAPGPERGRAALATRRSLAATVIGLAVLITLLPRIPFAVSPVTVPQFFSSAPVGDGEVVLVVPVAANFESRAMLWQSSSGMRFRMPEGYANRPGPSLDPPITALTEALIGMQEGGPVPAISPALRAAALGDFRRWGAAAVVVGPMERRDRVAAFLTELLGTSPSAEGGVLVWRLGGPLGY